MNPYGIIVVLLAFIGVGVGGMLEGEKIERGKWAAEKIAMQQAADQKYAQLLVARDTAKLQSEAVARAAAKEYEDEKVKLAGDYAANIVALRVHVNPGTVCGSPSPGTQATGAGQPDGGPTVQLPDDVATGLYALAERADETAAQLRALQDWVRANGFYGQEKEADTPPPVR